jgi:membrane protein implicated in regulation of membrane protease activity
MLSPSWGAIVVTGIAALVVPLAITVVLSYPNFGVGLLVGVVLPFAVRVARRISARLTGDDPKTNLRASRHDRMRVKVSELSHTDQ